MRSSSASLILLAGLAALAMGGCESMPTERAPQVAAKFPVGVSANGRHLVDAAGKPFLLHGDTAWSLVVQLSLDEAGEYLEKRRSQGFNAVLVNLIERYYAARPPLNRTGDAPFLNPNDFSTANEAYFAHADALIRRAGAKGILVILNPCYTGFSTDFKTSRDGWVQAMLANGPARCREYGRFIGRRYRDFTNIIWQAGGDATIPAGSDLESHWLEILQGIKEYAPGHHWTAHWRRFSTARDQAAFAPHMTLDNAYGGNRSYVHTLRAWNRPDPRPTFYNEGYYEDTNLGVGGVGRPPQMRAQAYWAMLSGATGHIFGSDHVWGFGAPRGYPGRPLPAFDWRAGLDRPSSREMGVMKILLEARAWHALVPDQDHAVVTKGNGTFGEDNRTAGGDYVAAARTSDGSLVMAYLPSTGTAPRTITVNMERLSHAAHARWYNPTRGDYVAIPGSPLANNGSRDFTTPGDNGTGANDWVLVLETRGKERGR